MSNKPKAFIFDLDGTLFDCDHRLHYVQNKPKNFRRFYEEIKNDTPIVPVIAMLYAVANAGHKIFFITGREETRDCAKATIDQLRTIIANIESDQYTLFMRKEKDHRQDFKVKKEIYEKMIKDRYDVVAVFEDRQQVIDMWRAEGLFVFDVKQTPAIF